jgi:DNA-binding transcriptional LysR family regulator
VVGHGTSACSTVTQDDMIRSHSETGSALSRSNINDLVAFVAVARARSFTKAAAKMGLSQSALSHTVRQLETRLGVRLLTRTTRAVSPTEAGERLLQSIGPHFDEIELQVDALNDLREKPAGTIRIVAADVAIQYVLYPKLKKVLQKYPDVKVELIRDHGLSDIVTERFDAGVRMGEELAKDMISARIGPDFRFAVVGSPGYFKKHPEPQHPKDLISHSCVNERQQTRGGLWAWEFEDKGREISIRVDGQLTFNTSFNGLQAALDGFGLAYIPEDLVLPHLKAGRLTRVLEKFCPKWDGYYLYYPSRRQPSAAFVAVLDALRHRARQSTTL